MARLGCAVSRLIRVASAHDGEAASNESGWSVSLSSDGTTVAIGAPVTPATALTPVTFVFTHGIDFRPTRVEIGIR